MLLRSNIWKRMSACRWAAGSRSCCSSKPTAVNDTFVVALVGNLMDHRTAAVAFTAPVCGNELMPARSLLGRRFPCGRVDHVHLFPGLDIGDETGINRSERVPARAAWSLSRGERPEAVRP